MEFFNFLFAFGDFLFLFIKSRTRFTRLQLKSFDDAKMENTVIVVVVVVVVEKVFRILSWKFALKGGEADMISRHVNHLSNNTKI